MDPLENATAKVFRRARGEAIDIATSAGLIARVCVIEVDGQRVKLVCIGKNEVRFEKRTRHEARHDARTRSKKRA